MGRDYRPQKGDRHDARRMPKQRGRGSRRRRRRHESAQTGRFVSLGFHYNGKGWYRRDGLVRCWLTPTPEGGLILNANIGGLLGRVQIGLEGRINRWQRLAGLQDVQVGDPAFDALAKLEGPPEVIIALMRDGTRRLLTQFLPAGLKIEGDALSFVWARTVPRRAMTHAVDKIWRLACRLSLRRERLNARLLSNANKSRCAAYALKSLQLFRELAGDKALRRAPFLARARQPAVRLIYARAVGPEGVGILARLVGYTDVDPAIRAEALEALTSAGPVPMETLLDLEAVREKPLVGAVSDLVTPFVTQSPDRLADCSEGILCLLLDTVETDLKLRVLDLLGQKGSEHCLPEVVALTRGLFVRSVVKDAATVAQSRILERVHGVAAGGLALVATPQRGALTLEAEWAEDDEED